MAVAHELAERPPERQRIDAMMGEKPLVLIGEQEIEEARIDILPRRRQPPAALIGRIGPQQPPLAIDHQRGIGQPLPQRRRPERHDPAGGERKQTNNAKRCAGQRSPHPAPRSRTAPCKGEVDPRSGSGGGLATNAEPVGKRDPHPAPEPVIGPAKGRTRWAPPSPFQGEGFGIIRLARTGLDFSFVPMRTVVHRTLIWLPRSRPCRWRCGRNGRGGTCLPHTLAAARSGRARPPAPHRRP